MPAAFAALEAQINAAGIAHLSNCAGTIAGAPFDGIFDGPFGLSSLGEAGIAAAEPQVACLTSAVPASPYGAAVVITTGQGVGSYTVREHRPDGLGMSVLLLAKA